MPSAKKRRAMMALQLVWLTRESLQPQPLSLLKRQRIRLHSKSTVDSLQLLIFIMQLQLHLLYHDRKVSQKAPESISERLKFKISWGYAPSHCMGIALGPPTDNKEPPHSRVRLRACLSMPDSYYLCGYCNPTYTNCKDIMYSLTTN